MHIVSLRNSMKFLCFKNEALLDATKKKSQI